MEEHIIGAVVFMIEMNATRVQEGMRYKKVVGYMGDSVMSACVGSQNFYLLSPEQRLFVSEPTTQEVG